MKLPVIAEVSIKLIFSVSLNFTISIEVTSRSNRSTLFATSKIFGLWQVFARKSFNQLIVFSKDFLQVTSKHIKTASHPR